MPGKKSKSNNRLGAILMAHGSSEPATAAEADALRRALSRVGRKCVFTLAWLNGKPNLNEAVDDLVAQGCETLHILPLLVFTGKHLRRDIPALLKKSRDRHPGLRLVLGPPLAGLAGFSKFLLKEGLS